MDDGVLRRLRDAITQVLSPEVKGGAFRDALTKVVNIIDSPELSSDDLSKSGMTNSDRLRLKEFASHVQDYPRKIPHHFLEYKGVEDMLIRIKNNIETIINV